MDGMNIACGLGFPCFVLQIVKVGFATLRDLGTYFRVHFKTTSLLIISKKRRYYSNVFK